MNLHYLCTAAGIECGEVENVEINAVKSNSEKIEKGDLFVCVKGLHLDGHDYIQKAIDRGAAAVISERPTECAVPVVVIENTRRALPLLCRPPF